MIENEAGAGFSIRRGLSHEIGQGKVFLGSSSEVYDAKIIEATEGLASAINNPMSRCATNITVCTDNQEATFRLLSNSPTATSSIFFFQKLSENGELEKVVNLQKLKKLVCIGPSHAGIIGNEVADSLAKAACLDPAPDPSLLQSIARAKRTIKSLYDASVAA